MDLAFYLTIRTLLFFKSLIGLADTLNKVTHRREAAEHYITFQGRLERVQLWPPSNIIRASIQIFTHARMQLTHAHPNTHSLSLSLH